MRSVSTNALAKLAEQYATEPIVIVDVQWAQGSGHWSSYADRDIGTSSNGRILEVGNLNNVIGISDSTSSQNLDVVLDDTKGDIKAIIDSHDVLKRDVAVYQWFEGLPLTDRFLLFRGKINSPVTWSERNRTVSFSVESHLEDKEIGFSPEEGEFTNIPDDLIGRAWPMCFGLCVHTPAVRLDITDVGTLGEGVGLRDFTIPSKLAALLIIIEFLVALQIFWAISAGYLRSIGSKKAADQAEKRANGFVTQQAQFIKQRLELEATYAAQIATERDEFRVIGGEDFPQGVPLVLDINKALFTGIFNGDTFSVMEAKHPEFDNFIAHTIIDDIVANPDPTKRLYPYAEGFEITQADDSTFFLPTGQILGEDAGPFFAQAGASVKVSSAEAIRYVASITPGTVIKVAAYATFQGGQRHLIDIPSNLYTVSVETFGTISATIITLHDALSKIADAGYEDEIYVTFESTVGPDTVEVIEYLIAQYTDLSTDSTSFEHVRTRLANYPSHFAYTDRRQIMQALEEIAFQSRCAIWLNNGVFYLRYLPEVPTSVSTFTESDIDGEENRDVQVFHSNTDDLITELVALWRNNGAQEKPHKRILRHNVKKYGIQSEEFDWYIYNNADLVLKAATFWLIRRSNTWKKIKFTGFVNKLNVETFDGVTLNFSHNYVANEAVVGVVEKADYDSDTKSLSFEVWTPVKSGTMVAYDLSYPADVDTNLLFPTIEEVNAGYDGGDGPGSGAVGPSLGNDRGGGLNVQYDGPTDPTAMGNDAIKTRVPRSPRIKVTNTPASPRLKRFPVPRIQPRRRKRPRTRALRSWTRRSRSSWTFGRPRSWTAKQVIGLRYPPSSMTSREMAFE